MRKKKNKITEKRESTNCRCGVKPNKVVKCNDYAGAVVACAFVHVGADIDQGLLLNFLRCNEQFVIVFWIL